MQSATEALNYTYGLTIIFTVFLWAWIGAIKATAASIPTLFLAIAMTLIPQIAFNSAYPNVITTMPTESIGVVAGGFLITTFIYIVTSTAAQRFYPAPQTRPPRRPTMNFMSTRLAGPPIVCADD